MGNTQQRIEPTPTPAAETAAAVADKVLSNMQRVAANSEINNPLGIKLRTLGGFIALMTSNVMSLSLGLAIIWDVVGHRNPWPDFWICALIFVGPVLNGWQFMGVRALLNTIMKNGTGIVDQVVGRFGFSRQPTVTNAPSQQTPPPPPAGGGMS